MAAPFNYQAYLKSPAWSMRRRQVFLRCGGVCEGCGRKPMEEVHHLTYEHVGWEFLWELKGLCTDCHQRIHNILNEDGKHGQDTDAAGHQR
jgi:5-methylcytosine-specific restriction endonuclease McrA